MQKLFSRSLAVLAVSVSMAGNALAEHCDPVFDRDIGPAMVAANGQPSGAIQTFTENCTGTSGCGDYFDINLANAANLFMTFCSNGGTGDFDTGLSIWGPNDPSTLLSCNDDTCGLLSELAFAAPSTDVYRVRIGGFGGSSGNYTLAYSANAGSIIAGGPVVPVVIPTLSQWAQILMVLLLLTAGMVAMRRLRVTSR
jgi:hypothetical protein